MEENYLENQQSTPQMPKPDNNLVFAILTTVCCCLPFGIVAIIQASKVNGLYALGQYEAAVETANSAKKWSIIGVCTGIAIDIIYTIVYGAALLV